MEHGNGNNMNRKLNKYILNFKKAYKYVLKVLEDGNQLSFELIKNINFKQGHFFTLLPEEADLSKIHQFFFGGIIPPKDVGYKSVILKNSTRRFTPLQVLVLRNELVQFIDDFLNLNKESACIFENVIKLISDPQNEFYRNYGMFFDKNIYYKILSSQRDKDIILQGIKENEEAWHFLCVLIDLQQDDFINKKLTLRKIRKISIKTKIIIVGAYDGEGYVFWEKDEEHL